MQKNTLPKKKQAKVKEKQDSKNESKHEAKNESKHESKHEAKYEAKNESKHEAKQENKPSTGKLLDFSEKIMDDYKKTNDKELDKISLKEFKLFIGTYQILKVIGVGARSKVLQVQKGKEKYAMKVMKINNSNIDDLANEKKVLQKINESSSPFLVKTHEFLQTNSYVCFVMEFLSGLSLESYMELFKNLSDEKITFFAACILLAMEALHSMNIFHRDISLRNVNMDAAGYVKLVDFGFSICTSDVLYGPRMSVINNKLVDFEDFGRCVWELLTKEKANQVPTIRVIETHQKLNKVSISFLKSLFECKSTRQHDQGKFLNGLKKHEFFKSIDWAKLAAKEMKSPYIMAIQPTGTSPIAVWQDIDTTSEFTGSTLDDDYSIVSTRKDKIERTKKSIE